MVVAQFYRIRLQTSTHTSPSKVAKQGERVVRDALLHPPDARPRTPAEGHSPSALPMYEWMLFA